MRKLFLLAAVLHMGAIFYLSSFPGTNDPPTHWLFRWVVSLPGGDKTAHLMEYALLGFLLQMGLRNPYWSFAIGVFYGISDEFHQSFVPLRDSGVPDLIADSVGTAMGILFATLVQKITSQTGDKKTSLSLAQS